MNNESIRSSCFQPVASYNWTAPSGAEIAKIMQNINWPTDEIGRYLGYPQVTVDDWLSDRSEIPFSAWCILCYQAGRGEIWKF